MQAFFPLRTLYARGKHLLHPLHPLHPLQPFGRDRQLGELQHGLYANFANFALCMLAASNFLHSFYTLHTLHLSNVTKTTRGAGCATGNGDLCLDGSRNHLARQSGRQCGRLLVRGRAVVSCILYHACGGLVCNQLLQYEAMQSGCIFTKSSVKASSKSGPHIDYAIEKPLKERAERRLSLWRCLKTHVLCRCPQVTLTYNIPRT